MNASRRTKYASTPTYGMQKRGFSKKSAPVPPTSAPDFSQMSNPGAAAFQQPSFGTFPPAAFPQASGIPPFSTPAQAPGAPGYPPPMAGMGAPNFSTPVSNGASSLQPPITNFSGAQAQPGNPFAPRAQGFVPPMPQQAPGYPPQGDMAAPVFQRPMVDPLAPAPFFPPYAGNPYGAPSPMPGAPFVAQPAPPAGNPAMGQGAPSMQQLNYPPTAARSKPPRQPLDPDRLWAVFLFGLLPALFVACLLLPPTFDPLRYGFIALSLQGL